MALRKQMRSFRACAVIGIFFTCCREENTSAAVCIISTYQAAGRKQRFGNLKKKRSGERFFKGHINQLLGSWGGREAPSSTAQHSMARHGTAQPSPAQPALSRAHAVKVMQGLATCAHMGPKNQK